MRVLVIDNYDSFVFNLVQALRVLGAEVLVERNDAVDVPEALALRADAILLSPGPKGPRDAGISVALVAAAAERAIPLLGVCLGHQAIVEAFGGTVERAPQICHGKTSAVYHDEDPLFAAVPSPFEAMRYHSLIAREPLPSALVRTAWTAPSPHSERTAPGTAQMAPLVMAVRHRELPIVGVQFHPESYRTPAGPTVLFNFLRSAADHTGV